MKASSTFAGMAALLLASATADAQPASAPQPSAATRAPSAEATRLVEIVNPEAAMVAAGVRAFVDALKAELSSSPDYQSLEGEYPGISKAVIDAGAAVVKQDLTDELPAGRRRYAAFYDSHFTTAEIAELTKFYASPAGQRLVAAKFANLNIGALAADDPNPDAPITQDQIRDLNRSASQAVVSGMSGDDLAALMEFSKQPVFQKLTAKRGAIEQIEAEIANEPDPELDKKLEVAISLTVEQYIESRATKK